MVRHNAVVQLCLISNGSSIAKAFLQSIQYQSSSLESLFDVFDACQVGVWVIGFLNHFNQA